MITVSGRSILPEESIAPSLYDIGWGLARTARFAGQTALWYPVLPHVYSVTSLVSEASRLDALLHDAAEVVVGDQVSTWKNDLTKDDENHILDLISKDLGIRILGVLNDEVRAADLACRAAEAELLGHAQPELFDSIKVAHPDLYEKALIVTAANMRFYRSEVCIHDTKTLAIEYETTVNQTILEVAV